MGGRKENFDSDLQLEAVLSDLSTVKYYNLQAGAIDLVPYEKLSEIIDSEVESFFKKYSIKTAKYPLDGLGGGGADLADFASGFIGYFKILRDNWDLITFTLGIIKHIRAWAKANSERFLYKYRPTFWLGLTIESGAPTDKIHEHELQKRLSANLASLLQIGCLISNNVSKKHPLIACNLLIKVELTKSKRSLTIFYPRIKQTHDNTASLIQNILNLRLKSDHKIELRLSRWFFYENRKEI